MSDNKILAIDPNMFTFLDNNTTRRKRDKPENQSKIKMKTISKPAKNTSLKKRSIINMMRKHQETQYKEKFNNATHSKEKTDNVSVFNNDFDSAKDYFKKLQESISKNTNPKNHTLKQLPSTNSSTVPISHNIIQPLHIPSLSDVTNSIVTSNITPTTNINHHIMPSPKYGCLKNGTLPTFRTLMNQTRKHVGDLMEGGAPSHHIADSMPVIGGTSDSSASQDILPHTKKAIQSNQIHTKLENMKRNKAKKKQMKRKKTIRRTYKIGRSKIMPKVSVLVSNKTIRNNITTKSYLIKQTPIHEIRKYLVKHGFIRVGSVTPNDVLRKMYESAMLMCGEIQNHNPDNLLYNFLHDVDK